MSNVLGTYLSALPPRTRLAAIFALGLLAGLAFAPTYLVPLWPLGFGVTLLFIYQAHTWRMRLAVSFLFSYGYMLSGLYWIALAPTAIPEFYFLIPLALIVLPVFAAGFGTLALFLVGFWRRGPLSFAIFAASFWMFFEWRRGIDLTGFAWNRSGMIWTVDPLTMQAASIGGVPLLSLVSVLLGVGVFLYLAGRSRLGASLILLPMIGLIAFGAARLLLNPQNTMEMIPDLKVRLVQANVPKNSFDLMSIYQTHLDLSTSNPLDKITHVIWPEGSIRAFVDQSPEIRDHLAETLAPAPFSLVFGRESVESNVNTRGAAHLSAYLIDHEKNQYVTYRKTNLVPFGEYIPYQFVLRRLGFSALTGQFLDRVPGAGPQTLHISDKSPRVGVFICYDSLYSSRIVNQNDRPQWLVTITEDAWYILPEMPLLAKTPGPYQHLAESRLRAVEEGLSVARASNPGISLVIDPFGRKWGQQLNLGDRGILDSSIPAREARTLYSYTNATAVYLLSFLILGIIGILCARNARA